MNENHRLSIDVYLVLSEDLGYIEYLLVRPWINKAIIYILCSFMRGNYFICVIKEHANI